MADRYDEERWLSRGPAGWDDNRDNRIDERDRHRGDRGFHRDRTDIFNRERSEHDRHERGPIARGADEVRSWFGDDDAQRRRQQDEQAQRRRDFDEPRDRYADSRNWRPERQSQNPDNTSSFGRDWSTGHPEAWSGGPSRPFRDDSNRSQWRGFEYNRSAGDYGRAGAEYNRASAGYNRQTPDYERHQSGYFDSSMGYAGASAGTGNLNPFAYRGAYAGRGPKNYQRSDERVREDVIDRLTDDDRVDASEIDVRVERGEVTLTGTVPDRSMRRCAEECVENLPGVRDVHNELKISQGNRGGIGEPGAPQERDDITSLNLSGAQNQQSAKQDQETRKR